jgi:hypothetical protein
MIKLINFAILFAQTVPRKSFHHQDFLTNVGVVLELLKTHINLVDFSNLSNQTTSIIFKAIYSNHSTECMSAVTPKFDPSKRQTVV